LRSSDGSLAFPDDVRLASTSGGTEGDGALVWAVAFEELGPGYCLSFSDLSLPGPGGTWRTEA